MDDEGMDDFAGEFTESSEIDLDYEFDASQFYDFTRPESNSEFVDAEHWFEIAGSYPPSPLILKYLEQSTSSCSSDTKSAKSRGKQADVASGSEVSQSTKNNKGMEEMKAKTQSVPKKSIQRNSTLMKPTACHLAKLNKASHTHSNYLCGRSHKPSPHMGQRRVQSPHGSYNAATKRQKLEIGYLRKGGSGSVSVAHFKTKVTVPKEPELETRQRAQNRRNNAETSEHAEPKKGTFKARTGNKQMLQAPSIVPPKKSTRKPPEFKVFHLKTMERAMQHSSSNEPRAHSVYCPLKYDLNVHLSDSPSQCGVADLKRSKSHHGLKKKCEGPHKIKTRSLNSKIYPTKEDIEGTKDINEAKISMESKLSKNERLSQNPPTELFNKLSLISQTVSPPKDNLPTKVPKENAPDYFRPEFWKCIGKPNQCGSGRGITGIAHQPGMNRSLGIR